MRHIFVSYAREDVDTAKRLAAIFRARGWAVWWDTRLKAGEVWDEVIEQALDDACCVVVLWSARSINKRWVRAEASHGLERNILVPALIESVRPPLIFRSVHYEDLTGWKGEDDHRSLLRLLDAVGGFVGQNEPLPLSFGHASGEDRFGRWAEIEVLPEGGGRPSVQRLRWIEPGSFQMGSPEDEPGRWVDEGPRHRVTLTQGFWLADTPCTQDFWQAVMGDNPSRFRSPDRPVEQVSWDDVQRFLAVLQTRLPGCGARLPTEAEWEYACRAGTERAIYVGEYAILGENSAPALDPIAWYGGNSGVGFELPEGKDSSLWPEKQYPHSRAGSRPVAGKVPNPWGLYDMLGNVLEWCADGMRAYTDKAQTDPVGPVSGVALRAVRGGSWDALAWRVRSASRLANSPGDVDGHLGFRLSLRSIEPGPA